MKSNSHVVTLLLILSCSILASKISHGSVKDRKSIEKKNLRERMMEECGNERDGYIPVDVSNIGPNTIGKKVMVTSTIKVSELASCTEMFCLTDECCNVCTSGLLIGDIQLVPANVGEFIGCKTNNCDWKECTYYDGDMVTVYALVAVDAENIFLKVDDHCAMAN